MGLVSSDDGWRLPDWLWKRLEPLLPAPPAHPLGCHRPRVPDRIAMDAILLVLRTGMQWNALSATGICSSSSAHRRFQEWEQAGVFHEIWRQGLLDYDEQVGIDWAWLSCDGATGKAPLGGEATGPNPTDRAKGGRNVRFSARRQGSRSGWRMTAPTATTQSSSPRHSTQSRSDGPSLRPTTRKASASTAATPTPGSTSSWPAEATALTSVAAATSSS
jgi:putative transposase